jgi:hypothetical protein
MANIKPFFSYDYLIRMFLEDIQSPLIVYLKPASNKHRLRKYNDKLQFILTRNCDKMWDRDSEESRSLNDL